MVVFVLSMLGNLIAYARGLRERESANSPGRILGRFLAVVGGLLTVIGLFLPWGRVDFADPALTGASYSTFSWYGDWIFLVFGLLWFTFFAVPRKIAAVWGFVWGILAILKTVLAVEGLEDLIARNAGTVYLDSGLYISILGSLFLIVGSSLAYLKAEQTIPREPPPATSSVERPE
ncbi:MAG: hypothetical protein E6K07_06605 [Methanobacteriota archaeon]|nr:MAG: hypothetical protein E6K07_06605 [Euryarchaeota archaeon]